MFEAAHSTASTSFGSRPAASSAWRAAFTAISASTEISSLGRSGMRGAITAGSVTPCLSTTKRDLMPDAFSMNSTELCGLGSTSPAAMAAAWSAFHLSAQALKLSTSSSLETECGGVHSPVAEMTGMGMGLLPLAASGARTHLFPEE